jgi:Domain of unknown function (DUF4383)
MSTHSASGTKLDIPRAVALALGIALAIAALSGLVPGLTDASGRTFGLFKLNAYQNLLHTVSALWAFSAAYISRSAAILFLQLFGTLYFLDGAMGLAIGSGYLDLGVLVYGVLDLPLWFKFLTSLPHLVLGSTAVLAGFMSDRKP